MPRWFAQSLALTTLCVLTGWAALHAAHLPNVGSCLWPPIGIGFVGMLVIGKRFIVGAWLATFVLLLIESQRYLTGTILPIPTSLAYAAGLSLIYTAQSLFGAWVYRYFIGQSVALLRVRDITIFLLVAGPVHTIFGATARSLALYYLQVYSGSELFQDWLATWYSDMLGGIFFAPLTLTLIGHPRDIWSKRISTVGIPLIIAVGLTVVGFLATRAPDANPPDSPQGIELNALLNRLENESLRTTASWHKADGLSQKDLLASRFTSNDIQFYLRLYKETIRSADSVTALVVIPDFERDNFEAATDADNTGSKITAPITTNGNVQYVPTMKRDQYVVVVGKLQSFDRYPQGCDLSQVPEWEGLIKEAAERQVPAVSNLEVSKSGHVVRVVLPCKQRMDGGITIPNRKGYHSVYGFIALELDPARLIEQAQKGHQGNFSLELQKSDRTATASGDVTRTAGSFKLGTRSIPIEIINKNPQKSLNRAPPYATVHGLIGVMLTIMLTALVLMATGRTALVEGEVRHRMADIQKEIQQRKLVEGSLRASEARLTEAQRITQLGYWEWKPLNDEMYWSPVLAAMLGVMGSDRIFKLEDLMVRVHPEDRQYLLNTIETMPQLQRTMQLEYRILRMDGVVRWFSTTITTSRTEQGSMVRGTVMEITERKRAEQALHDGKARLRVALDSAGMGTWEWYVGTQRLLWDAREEELFGFSPGQFDNRLATFYNCVHPDDRADIERKLNVTLETGQALSLEFRTVLVDGGIRWVAAHGQMLPASEGQPARVIGINFDITQRKEAELLLRTSEANLAEAQRLAKIGSFEWYPQTHQRWWSDEMYRVLGYEPNSVKPSFEAFLERVHPADREMVQQRMNATLTDGKQFNLEYRIQRPDGEVRAMRVDAVVTRDDAGMVVHFQGTNQDITQQKRIEESLRASEARLAEAQRMAHVGSWESVPSTDEFIGSEEMYRLMGLNSNVPMRHSELFDYIHVDERQRVRNIFERAYVDGGSMEAEFRFIRPTGTMRHFFIRAKVIRDNDIVRLIGTTQDVTDQKIEAEQKRNFEVQLQQTQKLESLGILAGGVAHDFNNLLTGILGNASLARELLPSDSELQEFLRPIEKSAEHAAQLCQQMLTYAGQGSTIRSTIDLNTLIEESRDLLRLATSKKTTLITDMGTDLPPFEGDVSQLRQVLLNLVQNASEAIGSNNGTITIRTTVSSEDPIHGENTTCWAEHLTGETVCLEITDTGCGMDEGTRSRIFEPFFTTKFTGRGLGLSAVHGIVCGHNGTICVTSKPQVGTTFHIYLPCHHAPLTHDTNIEQDTPPPITWADTDRFVALVVDDEKTIRGLASVALRALGFRVVEAADGREALDLFLEEPDQFRFVLLDAIMPVVDGREVLIQMHAIRPKLPVVLMSGYNEYELGKLPYGRNLIYLQKPFRAADLNGCIRRILGQTPSPVG